MQIMWILTVPNFGASLILKLVESRIIEPFNQFFKLIFSFENTCMARFSVYLFIQNVISTDKINFKNKSLDLRFQ